MVVPELVPVTRITATESRSLRAIKLNLLDRDVPSRFKMEITPDMRFFSVPGLSIVPV